MSEKHLALPLDIHGGGQDLIFPHHENEIAQTEADTGAEFSKYWVHNGFVQVDAEKMSKSLGNFKTIRDILESYLPETLRYFLVTKQYRSPIDFTFDAMDEAEKNLRRVYTTIQALQTELERSKWSRSELPAEVEEEINGYEEDWLAAMKDDLNTAGALASVFGAVRLANRILEDKTLRKAEAARALFERILSDLALWGEVFGCFKREPAEFLAELRDTKAARKQIDPTRVEELLVKRLEARKAKDFAAADGVRDELTAMGVEVKDTPQGQVWDIF